MESFPAFIPLAGRTVVVVGEGGQADAKARLFDGSPARLVRLTAAVGLDEGAYAGAALVFVAVDDAAAAARARAAAKSAGALVNVVDRPELCDFSTPAIVDRGPVVGAIGTCGASPVLASRLRSDLEAQWPAALGGLAALLRELRPELRARFPDLAARRAFVDRLLSGAGARAALAGDRDGALALVRREMDAAPVRPAHGRLAWFAAPAESDRLTLAAVRALAAADRIVADDGVAEAVLAFARREAWRGSAAAPAELAAWVADGLNVVRIVGHAPDRASADIEAARALGVEVEPLPTA